MKVFLWVYQEKQFSTLVLYPTFLTSQQANDTFKGYYFYRRFVSQDFNGVELM